MRRITPVCLCAIVALVLGSCASKEAPRLATVVTESAAKDVGQPGTPLPRKGDEIMVAGQLFHTGAAVVLWLDPGGYDAYRSDRRFAAYEQSSYAATTQETQNIKSPNRYSLRYTPPATQPATRPSAEGVNFVLAPEQIELARANWPLAELQKRIDQFVYHYDVAGTSRNCFKVLHDMRGLSVHFMLDLDGTIYQTLDLKERAWHATTSNTRSIGIEIANMGAYPSRTANPLVEWYPRDEAGRAYLRLPERFGDGGIRDRSQFPLRPARGDIIAGQVQGRTYHQYDLTPQQYDSLIKLTATLCTVFPNIKCDYPRDNQGKLIPHKLSDEQLAGYQGLIGHYHIQRDKQDPGPAFQWDKVVAGARALMKDAK